MELQDSIFIINQIGAHSFVLVERSEYFRRMLSERSWREGVAGKVDMSDVRLVLIFFIHSLNPYSRLYLCSKRYWYICIQTRWPTFRSRSSPSSSCCQTASSCPTCTICAPILFLFPSFSLYTISCASRLLAESTAPIVAFQVLGLLEVCPHPQLLNGPLFSLSSLVNPHYHRDR